MINRHNYEEFFLMYVDNELTTQQRAEVEVFVQQNPDLQKEFEMLQQTKLMADDEIMFAHKTDLLKIKESIGIDNYQEYFLLYIDNELNETGKEAVETFVLQHPQLQEEFTLLKQTVLPQEKIVFPNKKLLHRKEERRVVPLYVTRVAAAAAITGAVVLAWWLVPGTKHNNIEVANTKPGEQTIKPAQNQKQDSTMKLVIPQAPTNDQLAEAKKVQDKKDNKEAVAKAEKKKSKTSVENKEQSINKNKGDDNIAVNSKKDNEVNNSSQQGISQDKINNDAVVKNNPVVTDNNIENENPGNDPLEDAKSKNAMNDKSNIIQHAAYKELNTNDDENRNAFYIGNMELNKNKVRGIMKKVGGLFAGKSKNPSDEKGKLQVANFELNTN